MLNLRIWLQGGLLLGAVTVALADSGFLPNLFPFKTPLERWKRSAPQGKSISPGRFFRV